MTEHEQAIELAGRVLDRGGADPDDDLAVLARQFLRVSAVEQFTNRMRSLLNVRHHLLPELTNRDWREFLDSPFGYFINGADQRQRAAIWREIEKRQS